MGKSCSVRHLLGRRADPGPRLDMTLRRKCSLLSSDVDGAETVAVVRCAPAFMTGSPRSHETAGEPRHSHGCFGETMHRMLLTDDWKA